MTFSVLPGARPAQYNIDACSYDVLETLFITIPKIINENECIVTVSIYVANQICLPHVSQCTPFSNQTKPRNFIVSIQGLCSLCIFTHTVPFVLIHSNAQSPNSIESKTEPDSECEEKMSGNKKMISRRTSSEMKLIKYEKVLEKLAAAPKAIALVRNL